MGFVGNYAPWGLSPQTDGMPVIPKKSHYSYNMLYGLSSSWNAALISGFTKYLSVNYNGISSVDGIVDQRRLILRKVDAAVAARP